MADELEPHARWLPAARPQVSIADEIRSAQVVIVREGDMYRLQKDPYGRAGMLVGHNEVTALRRRYTVVEVPKEQAAPQC